jgi:hypothetical protein
MRIDDALMNTGWTVKADARQREQLRVSPGIETTVDPERNDAWTALTMAALTARLNATQSAKRRWNETLIPTDTTSLNEIEKDAQQLIANASAGAPSPLTTSNAFAV